MLSDTDRNEIRRMIREGVKDASQVGGLPEPQGRGSLTPGGKTGCAVLVQLPMLFILLILGAVVFDTRIEDAWRAEEGEVASIQVMAMLVEIQQVSSRGRSSWEAILREVRARAAVTGEGEDVAGRRRDPETDIRKKMETLERDHMQIMEAIHHARRYSNQEAMASDALQQLQHSFSKWMDLQRETLSLVGLLRERGSADARREGLLDAMERMDAEYRMAMHELENQVSIVAEQTKDWVRHTAEERVWHSKSQSTVMLILIGIGCLLCLGGMVAVGVLCRTRGKAMEA